MIKIEKNLDETKKLEGIKKNYIEDFVCFNTYKYQTTNNILYIFTNSSNIC